MSLDIIEKILSEYGFGVAMAGAIVLIFFKVLQWIANSTSKREDNLFKLIESQQNSFQKIMQEYEKTILENSENTKAYQKFCSTAFEYQRREHEKIIKLLETKRGSAHDGKPNFETV